MGKRREPRKVIKVAVRIFGTDAQGHAFSENVSTVNVSRSGAMLEGVRSTIKAGEVIGVTYGKSKGRFCVKWVGEAGTPQAGLIGLQTVTAEYSLWDFPLPPPGVDEYGRLSATERRRQPRLQCVASAELHPEGQEAPIWTKVADLSLGGCSVDMPIPLPVGTKLKIVLWIQEGKLWLAGEVANSRPGFGMGIQFTEISEPDQEKLKRFLQSIRRMPF